MTSQPTSVRTWLVFPLAFSILLTAGYCHAHFSPLNGVAVNACENKARSEACQYQGGHNDLYMGTCQYMSTVLMCVRNKPIQKVNSNKTTSLQEHKVAQETPAK